jgi:hypothetical protein
MESIGPYIPELNELAEKAISMVLEAEGTVITRGILTCEVLRPGDEHRSVIAVQLGQQGEMTPWDVVGLLAPVALKSQAIMTTYLMGEGGL